MDVEPHAPDVVAEDVVVVAFAAWLDHAQVGHRQVAWLITVHLVKVLSCLSIIQKGTFFPQRTRLLYKGKPMFYISCPCYCYKVKLKWYTSVVFDLISFSRLIEYNKLDALF